MDTQGLLRTSRRNRGRRSLHHLQDLRQLRGLEPAQRAASDTPRSPDRSRRRRAGATGGGCERSASHTSAGRRALRRSAPEAALASALRMDDVLLTARAQDSSHQGDKAQQRIACAGTRSERASATLGCRAGQCMPSRKQQGTAGCTRHAPTRVARAEPPSSAGGLQGPGMVRQAARGALLGEGDDGARVGRRHGPALLCYLLLDLPPRRRAWSSSSARPRRRPAPSAQAPSGARAACCTSAALVQHAALFARSGLAGLHVSADRQALLTRAPARHGAPHRWRQVSMHSQGRVTAARSAPSPSRRTEAAPRLRARAGAGQGAPAHPG